MHEHKAVSVGVRVSADMLPKYAAQARAAGWHEVADRIEAAKRPMSKKRKGGKRC